MTGSDKPGFNQVFHSDGTSEYVPSTDTFRNCRFEGSACGKVVEETDGTLVIIGILALLMVAALCVGLAAYAIEASVERAAMENGYVHRDGVWVKP